MDDDIVARSIGTAKPIPADTQSLVKASWRPDAVLSIYCYTCREVRSLTAEEKEREGIAAEGRFKAVDDCAKCRAGSG